jgi:uncharacterized membrane protein
MLTVFLGIETRRYRVYDIWRSRVRILEENVFANSLDPEGVEQTNWRELLSDDFRNPTVKTPLLEAVSRRLRRVYFALISVMVGAWIVRLTVFASTDTGFVGAARIGAVAGEIVLVSVAVYLAAMIALIFLPAGRQAKGELKSRPESDEWK